MIDSKLFNHLKSHYMIGWRYNQCLDVRCRNWGLWHFATKTHSESNANIWLYKNTMNRSTNNTNKNGFCFWCCKYNSFDVGWRKSNIFISEIVITRHIAHKTLDLVGIIRVHFLCPKPECSPCHQHTITSHSARPILR